MKPLILMLALLCVSTANAEMVADAAFGVKHDKTELRLNLPTEQREYITIFGTGDRLSQAKAWFDSNDELRAIKASSHFNVIDTTSAMFKHRYAATTPNKLTIRFQDARGRITHETSDLGLSAESFIKQTNECFRRSCPAPAPDLPRDPEPAPLPVPAPKPQLPWLLLAGLAIVGAIAGAHNYFRKLYKGQ